MSCHHPNIPLNARRRLRAARASLFINAAIAASAVGRAASWLLIRASASTASTADNTRSAPPPDGEPYHAGRQGNIDPFSSAKAIGGTVCSPEFLQATSMRGKWPKNYPQLQSKTAAGATPRVVLAGTGGIRNGQSAAAPSLPFGLAGTGFDGIGGRIEPLAAASASTTGRRFMAGAVTRCVRRK